MARVRWIATLLVPGIAAGVVAGQAASIQPFQQDEGGAVYFETVHELPQAAADDLFTKAERWVTETFAPHEIVDRVADSKRAWITFHTLIVTPKGWRGFDASGDGYARFEIQLAFKDGRAKFRATDFHFLIDRRFGGDGKMRVDAGDDTLFLKSGKKQATARAELSEILAGLSDSLGEALAAAGGPDW